MHYQGRHAARHGAGVGKAASAADGRVGGSHRAGTSPLWKRPIGAASAVTMIASGAAAVSVMSQQTATATAEPLALTTALTTKAKEQSQAVVADSRRLAQARATTNTATSRKVALADEQARRKAEELAKARKAEAERVARAKARKAVIANAQADPQAAARLLLAEAGWGDAQFGCLVNLWQGESGWNYRAENASSGAYGIPQSLPGSKMATVASDWRTNPVTQITWGLNYIRSSYGSPCNAWAKWQSRYPHWY